MPGALSFGLDSAGMTAIWIAMMGSTAKRARPNSDALSKDTMSRLLVGVFASAGAYWTGSKILTSLITWLLPGIGTGTAMTLNALFNGVYTWRLGHTIANLFERPNIDITDLDTMRQVLTATMRPIPHHDGVAHGPRRDPRQALSTPAEGPAVPSTRRHRRAPSA